MPDFAGIITTGEMKAFLFTILTACLLCGCAHTEFAAYTGNQQIWKTGNGPLQKQYQIPVYYGWPDQNWKMVGYVFTTGSVSEAVEMAKRNGAEAVIYAKSDTVHSGDIVLPGVSHTSVNGTYGDGLFNATARTQSTPPVVIPRYTTRSLFYAIRWATTAEVVDDLATLRSWSTGPDDGPVREQIDKGIDQFRVTAEGALWLSEHFPDGGAFTNNTGVVTKFTKEQIDAGSSEARNTLQAIQRYKQTTTINSK